ncbi:angiogenin-2 [Austrofundulus limnaeus]|uniref:Angiogenin-2 n=1 Tax=Austrofundulus limnaeus TaxID=52670 RepID=A0A2I4AXD8_AUSLI|nr:PREDICTED: angiogenin-2-like [Austrofundulus limnaeus]
MTHPTSALNDAPCQRSKWNNAFQTFIRRHLPSGAPNSLNPDEWRKYIQSVGKCDRPTQSFLHPEDLDRVKAVCSSSGGKVYRNNLCISRQPFTFVTVRSVHGTCGIKNVTKETKHLILACELLEDQCVPVHFEGNPKNQKPENNAYSCQDPDKRNQAVSCRMTWFCLFLLLCFVYGF